MNNLGVTRRNLLRATTGAVIGAAVSERIPAEPLTARPSRVDIVPVASFALSPYLYMQFMEPLGTTDGSVEASWDHLTSSWRPDLVAATQKLAPPMLRWGGLFSAYYRWREGVGPRADRKPMHNLFWGGVETNQIGTDEFLDFCGEVGAEPLMCINFASEGDPKWAVNGLGEQRAGDAREAADWVRYCNAPVHAERAANGHPTARPIRYWQIGNETSLANTRFNKEQAIAHTIDFARAMRAADETIKLIAWGDSGWARDMIEGAGELVDFIAFHHLFDPGPACRDAAYIRDPAAAWQALMASIATQEAKIREIRAQTGSTPLAMTESHYLMKGRNRGDLNSTWAVGVAYARFQNLHQRHGDVLKIANLGDFCGTRWQTNVIMLPTPRGEAYLMPVGKVAELYRRHTGTHAVALGAVPDGLDMVASRTADTIYMHVVNATLDRAVSCTLSIAGKHPRSVRAIRLSADNPFREIESAAEDPVVREEQVLAAHEAIRFPAASVTAIELKV
nr:alpha-L-arabinofuranosidase [Sphingomonas sp.]